MTTMTNLGSMKVDQLMSGVESMQDCEELAFHLLSLLPRPRLATIQRRIAPLLQFDLVGSLPTEVGLQIFAYLPYQFLLNCARICHRWQALADDQTLWKNLCEERGWKWRHAPKPAFNFDSPAPQRVPDWDDADDEGMGDSDEEDADSNFGWDAGTFAAPSTAVDGGDPSFYAEQDSGIASSSTMSIEAGIAGPSSSSSVLGNTGGTQDKGKGPAQRSPTPKWTRHSAPAILKSSPNQSSPGKPDYKLLFLTHIKLKNRFITSNYRLSALQIRDMPRNGHTSSIYCLQLYTYPDTGKRVLFTGSRDHSIREWNLSTGAIERVISGVHTSSVLSICVRNGYIASAGGDRKVVVWHLASNSLVKILSDHSESVLGVRFDDQRLVSCSKDRTVRIYSFPALELQFALHAHRSAVNAVALSDSFIVSASGDRSIRLWDAETGKLLQIFEGHHSKGIASIDFSWPVLLSGSSDQHVRLFDLTTLQGWYTSPEYDNSVMNLPLPHIPETSVSTPSEPRLACQDCGSNHIKAVHPPRVAHTRDGVRCCHTNLVRTVALGEEFVISGSYDKTIKIWDPKTGAVLADLAGGHTARIFCLDFDITKIVSCGEDQRICVWDFSHGIDTSFLDLS